MSDPLQTYLGIKLLHLIAGFFGGLVRALVRPGATLWYSVSTTFVGAVFAAYTTPVVAFHLRQYLGAEAPGTEGLTGFILGLCGLALAEGVITLAKRWRDTPKLPPGLTK